MSNRTSADMGQLELDLGAPRGPSIAVLWDTRDWAAAIAALPVSGPLPCRTVLVPRERVAHALRREIIRAGYANVLAGTRFVPIGAAAVEVLHAAGIGISPGEDALRRPRVAALLKNGVPLTHFPIDLLRTKLGWDEAFARTVSDLEAAGLRPEDLEARDEGDGRLRDVAAIWRALDAAADRCWTVHRILGAAADLLETESNRWPYPGPVLAVATGDAPMVEARFVRMIPGVTVALMALRPVRAHYLDRVAALFGSAARDAVAAAVAPRRSESERALLATYLFEPPAVLADRTRPRSRGPDGTVDIEQHAGLEEELEATADWVGREIVQGTPLEEIAVLLPALDPLAGLVAERLSRLPWPDGRLPVHVAGGLRFVETAAGARTLALVRALRGHLNGAALAAVLPSLRTVDADGRHLSHGSATDLVWALGTVGGSSANREGAFEWTARARKRDGDLAQQLRHALDAADDPDRAGLARQARDLERLLADLRAVRPALDALVDVARRVVGDEPLVTLWPCLRQFLQEWLLQPGSGPRAHALLDEALGATATDAVSASITGEDALRLVEETAAAIRLPEVRFGEPAVYIGTVQSALGLPFRSVRIIGLAEGHLPALPREDPVIPDALRARLLVPGMDGHSIRPSVAGNRSLGALHALDGVVRNTTARLALSAPRLDVERSLREPASVILEAAAALGRPDSATGGAGPDIPDSAALERDGFRPAHAALLAWRRELPIGEAAWHDLVAARTCGAPPHWTGAVAVDLARIEMLRLPANALDGILGPGCGVAPMPGLAPEQPISPSKLRDLLQCPHLFLLGTLLGFDEPPGAPTQREIGQPAYGALLHLITQAFYQEHGAAFCARQENLDHWRALADTVVERVFVEFLEQYPLSGTAVRNKERERVRRDFHDWLAYDWRASGRRFVAVERAFGRPEPLEIAVGRRSLYVRGQIDRIDVDGSLTVIRDLKTARARPRGGRENAPDPVLDVQLAVYALAVERLAASWQLPGQIGGAYSYVNRGTDERDWRSDFDRVLKPAAEEWMALATDLLETRAFPRTPKADDCTHCRFRPVCGDGYERARELLAHSDGVLARFAELKPKKDERNG